MSEELFIAAITGPAGSGKSTVGFLLRKQINKCVNIDVDDITHFIGFEYDLTPDGIKKWRFEEWKLAGQSIGLLARNFHKAGFNVLITGYLKEEAIKELQQHLKLTHRILLLPKVDTAIARDSIRDGDFAMGTESVEEHHDYFTNNKYFSDFIKIDSTNDTKEQTVEKIKGILSNG